MPRRIRINWPLWMGFGVFLLVLTHYIAWPMIEHIIGVTPETTDKFGLPPDPGEMSRERAITAVVAIWFFSFGASIGSFLNVVAYRMPMGLTFVSKPSRCPYCETPILFKHNVPILGWLALRGRCNACRLPISPRYIFVEVVVGAMFLTLFLREIASGGRNLPIREPNSRSGIMWNLLTPQLDLIGLYAFHVFLIGVVATIALIKFDKLKIPIQLGVFTLFVAAVCRLVWPSLCLTVVASSKVELLQGTGIDLAFGAVCGQLLQLVISTSGRHRFMPSVGGSVVIGGLVGVFLGWQAVAPVLIIASMWQLGSTLVSRIYDYSSSRLWGISLMVGTWLTLCFWRQMPSVWLPGAETPMKLHAMAIAFVLATAFVAESLAKTNRDEANEVVESIVESSTELIAEESD